MSLQTEQLAECGGISIALAILPTIAFLISEALPYISKKDKCNGVLQTCLCALQHIIKKEPCSSEEIEHAIQSIQSVNIEEGKIGEEDTT